jgi:hypothetical protein
VYGAFNNVYSELPPDVIVTQNVYGWNNGGYVIARFNIKNMEASALDAMAGLDIIPYINEEYGYDTVTYLSDSKVIRFHRGSVTNMGIKLLSTDLQSLYSFEWYEDYYVDSSYWNWMNTGAVQAQYVSETADGPVTITAQAPVTLNTNESFNLYYAFALGADETELLANMDAAMAKYQTLITGIDNNFTSKGLLLEQNSPNPFKQNTSISYNIPSSGNVSLKVYNVVGNEISTLVNQVQGPGTYTVRFGGNDLPAGVYFYTLRFNNEVKTSKMVLAN